MENEKICKNCKFWIMRPADFQTGDCKNERVLDLIFTHNESRVFQDFGCRFWKERISEPTLKDIEVLYNTSIPRTLSGLDLTFSHRRGSTITLEAGAPISSVLSQFELLVDLIKGIQNEKSDEN